MTSSKKIAALLVCGVGLWGGCAWGAEEGAVSTVQARRAAARASAEQLGAGGVGSDLKAIASPKKKATTFTGFPEGTLPGSEGSGEGAGGDGTLVPGRVVLSGDPLEPLVGASHIGTSLDRICAMADHVGYALVPRRRYVPSALDAPYSYLLMNGRRRVATLSFDRSLKLASID